MTAVEIIAKKRDGKKLSPDEISFFINSYLKNDIKDYQMSALLMAIYLRGMDFDETACLTDVMLHSGNIIAFPRPDRLYVDKHSSGGIGDKVSLILAPWVAACGVKVPMLSGRGLGHTGGTLDKLESIPGYRTDLSLDEFKRGVEEVGCVITGQTEDIAPADRFMYALRDVTATVESIPLICGSILSKKFAAGPSGLVFDIKCGNGAFMKTLDSAIQLAENLIGVCKSMGKAATALITDMNQPLGYAAGNLLEVSESIDALKGKNFAPDLYLVTLELAIEMLVIAGIETDHDKAKSVLEKKLADGSAWDKFEDMVHFQKGNLSIFQDHSKLPKAPVVYDYESPSDGYIEGFETEAIGRLIVEMGGGRKTKDDIIDPLIGLVFHKKIGDAVKKRDIIAVIHSREKNQADYVATKLHSLIKIGTEKTPPPKLIKMRL